jgi:hypothetical protein
MTGDVRLSLDIGECLGLQRPPRSAFLRDLKAHVAAFIRTCADYREAAATYQELSKLADAELRRRGLARATLARDVCAACSAER